MTTDDTGRDDEQVARASRIGKLFDVRLLIGGLLGLYGVILVVKGATDSRAAVAKAGGVRINLWTGLAMVVVAAFFLAWIRIAPLQQPTEEELREATEAGNDPANSG